MSDAAVAALGAWLGRARRLRDAATNAVLTRVARFRRLNRPQVAPGSKTDPPRPFGVNVAGYFGSEKGVGEAVRSDVRSLRAAGLPHALCDVVDTCGSENVFEIPRPVRAPSLHVPEPAGAVPVGLNAVRIGNPIPVAGSRAVNPFAFNLVHVNADQAHVFVGQRTADWFEGRVNIGYWVWELQEFPDRWRSSFDYFDEIWTPSRFAQDAISRLSPVPVLRFPHSIAVDRAAAEPWRRADLGIPDDAFVFLFMFDYYSVFERKNPLGLVEAFRRAFRGEPRVWLLVKTCHREHDRASSGRLARAGRGLNVRIVDEVLGRERTDGLLDLCDAYVSLHRSEGFGLTLAEAMSRGKPVIATAHGGNVDFQNQANSFCVPYELRPLERDHGPYGEGNAWAHPDLDRAAELMRFVVQSPSSAAAFGARARADVQRDLAPQIVGASMRRRLCLLAEHPPRNARRSWGNGS